MSNKSESLLSIMPVSFAVIAVIILVAGATYMDLRQSCNRSRQVVEVFEQCATHESCSITTDDVRQYKRAVANLEACAQDW